MLPAPQRASCPMLPAPQRASCPMRTSGRYATVLHLHSIENRMLTSRPAGRRPLPSSGADFCSHSLLAAGPGCPAACALPCCMCCTCTLLKPVILSHALLQSPCYHAVHVCCVTTQCSHHHCSHHQCSHRHEACRVPPSSSSAYSLDYKSISTAVLIASIIRV